MKNFALILQTGFYKSMGDKYAALDVSDHKEVDATYGTLDDFKNLVDGVHENEMKLIIDFIPKHASDVVSIELLNFWSDKGVDGFRVGESFLTYGNIDQFEIFFLKKKIIIILRKLMYKIIYTFTLMKNG